MITEVTQDGRGDAQKFVLLPRFLREITIHLVKNWSHAAGSTGAVPLLLGIDGPPGVGKTFMTEGCLRSLGVRVIHFSGGELEHAEAAEPRALLLDKYAEASDAIRRSELTAIVVNDIDAGVGSWGDNVQYTVNRQNVSVTLMNLCDNPYLIRDTRTRKERETHRVPVILTGNNFSSLHAPLLRSGRMRRFTWIPEPKEKSLIVSKIFSWSSITLSEVDQLVEEFSDQPFSFFSDIASNVCDARIWEATKNATSQHKIRVGIEHVINETSSKCGYSELLTEGRLLRKRLRSVSHLEAAIASRDVSEEKLMGNCLQNADGTPNKSRIRQHSQDSTKRVRRCFWFPWKR